MNLFDELMAVTQALDRQSVDYALVGGLAVAVWGAARATKDIDLLVRPEEVERAKASIRACGYTLEAVPMTFSDGMRLHRVNKVDGSDLSTVDFILVDHNLEPVWLSRRVQPVEGGEVRVVGRDALIAMKLAAGRPQDQADVIRLTEQDR
ncbi:MAG TPA: DUF6036 family nucleotidyltransferase [Polyangiaceae bacterium]|nr:DUF6036 family nucleotidyltransferase [Polyangiaceae bacterium]